MSQSAWCDEVLALSKAVYLHISRDQIITDAVGDTQTLLNCERETLIGLAPDELTGIHMQLGVAVSRCLSSRNARVGETWEFKDGAGIYYHLSDGSSVIKLTPSFKVDQGMISRLVDRLPIMVAYVDKGERFRLNNQAYADFFNISPEDLYGQPVTAILDADSYAKVRPRFQEALSGKEVAYEGKLSLVDGRTFYLKVQYIPDFLESDVVGFYALIQDVSEYRAIIQLLRDIHSGVNRTDISTGEIVERLLQDALAYLSLDIGLVSRIIGEQYIVKWAASKTAIILPGDTFALGETYCRLMLDAEDVFYTIQAGQDARFSGHPCYQQLKLESYIGAPLYLSGEVWGTLNFSSARARHQPFTPVEIELVKLLTNAVERVITDAAKFERVRKERDLMADRASHDYLTGLPNRSYLEQHVAVLIREHETRDEPFSLAVIDIDHFKSINDSHGHDTGDAVLQWLGAKISECLSEEDMLARVGGEEFVVALSNDRSSEADNIMERIRTHILTSTLLLECGKELHLTISSGLSEHVKGESYSGLFKRADTALYAAKRAGRNRVCRG
ncbi:MAG: sensor domain-containing diguanylate cyclase [Halomonas sp.]|nr:diguanylate cyclase [Halomonas sp.]TVP50066.1 MAG: sensor domain-containing diguanylate cyclase [Halomonas sp.]